MADDLLGNDLPIDWFNQVCKALGLFDGARPVSPRSILWREVLPAIEALKANNPEAATLVRENQRAYGLWSDALSRLAAVRAEGKSAGIDLAVATAKDAAKAAIEQGSQEGGMALVAFAYALSRAAGRGPA